MGDVVDQRDTPPMGVNHIAKRLGGGTVGLGRDRPEATDLDSDI